MKVSKKWSNWSLYVKKVSLEPGQPILLLISIALSEFSSFHLFWAKTGLVCGKCFHSGLSHIAWK